MRLFIIVLFVLLSFSVQPAEVMDFSLPMFGTKENFKLSNHWGKKTVLINFFASWCTSCITELPELHALQKKYGEKDYIFLAINAGERKKKIKKFLKKHKFNYMILEDPKREVSKLLGVEVLPRTLVISKDKKVVFDSNRPPKEL